MELLLRVAGALVLGVVAVTSPVMGWAAAEPYESRKLYRVFEGDWLFLCTMMFTSQQTTA